MSKPVIARRQVFGAASIMNMVSATRYFFDHAPEIEYGHKPEVIEKISFLITEKTPQSASGLYHPAA